MICPTCKNTGRKSDGDAEIYCHCPIGDAYSAAWMGMGHEEEAVEAIDKLMEFIAARSPGDHTEDGT